MRGATLLISGLLEFDLGSGDLGSRMIAVWLVLFYPADRLQITALAGLRILARFHFSAAGNKIARHLLDILAPVVHLLCGKVSLHQCSGRAKPGDQSCSCIAHASGEAHITP